MTKENNKGLIFILICFFVIFVAIFSGYSTSTNLKKEISELEYLNSDLIEKNLELVELNLEIIKKDSSEIYNKISELEKAPDCNCKAESYCYAYEDSEFDLILKNNANEVPYILDYYDCSEFSEELKNRLENVGFKADTKVVGIDCDEWSSDWDYMKETTGYGYEDCKENNLHQIVKIRDVYIESTSGEVIMPYKYSKYGLK